MLYIIGEGNATPLQCSCLENPMDGVAWKAAVHGVTEGQTRLSDFTFTFHFHALEKEMATPSSVLAWRIPGTGEPGGLPSVGSHRVGHAWCDSAAAAAVAVVHYILMTYFIHNIWSLYLFMSCPYIPLPLPILTYYKQWCQEHLACMHVYMCTHTHIFVQILVLLN